MRYDLTSIPATATVTSAKLSLFAFQLQATGGLQVGIGKIASAWDTGTVTWAQMTSADYNYGTSTVPGELETWKEFDVTAVINQLVKNPASNFGFVLKQIAQDAEDFYSNDFPDVVYRPRLVVTYEDGVDRVASPVFSAVNPAFINTMQQTISCATAGATIRYTTDGSEPTEASTAYTTPLSLNTTAHLRVKAFLNGKTASATVATLCQKVGGLNFKFFKNAGTGVPVLDGLTPDSIGLIPWFLESQWASQQFRVRYDGFINIPETGQYRFYLSFVNGTGRFLINGTVCQPGQTLTLNKGWQAIVVDAQKTNNVGIQFGYIRGATRGYLTPVPPSMLSATETTAVDQPRRGMVVISTKSSIVKVESSGLFSIRGQKIASSQNHNGTIIRVTRSTDGVWAERAILAR